MFPELKTSHFKLRRIISSDQQKVFEALSDPSVIKYFGVSYTSFEDTGRQMEWFQKLLETQTGIWWAICFTGQKELIGACGFNSIKKEHKKAEMGFWLFPDHWKKGIMTEVIPAIISYAFNNLNLHRIEALAETENTGSKKLLEKLGFKLEGTMQDCEFKRNRYISLDFYALIGNSTE
jgi:ribosomal-protein-alanine N-acetyltransferase